MSSTERKTHGGKGDTLRGSHDQYCKGYNNIDWSDGSNKCVNCEQEPEEHPVECDECISSYFF